LCEACNFGRCPPAWKKPSRRFAALKKGRGPRPLRAILGF
jgi:hypothetical protein